MSRPSPHELAMVVDALCACAMRLTGFSVESLRRDGARQLAERQLAAGIPAAQLLREAETDAPRLLVPLAQSVTVVETYFFRHEEQLAYLTDRIFPRLEPAGRALRLWSAGCATGEEVYSLAACLSDWGKSPITVVGTDIVAANVEIARAGVYGSWSVRRGAGRWTAYEPAGPDRFRVRNALRAGVDLRVHNLLDGSPDADPFDVVLCRNVLVYFSDAARARALDVLVRSLAPGGYLVLGPMDSSNPPPMTIPAASAELQIFQRKAESPQPEPPARVVSPPSIPPMRSMVSIPPFPTGSAALVFPSAQAEGPGPGTKDVTLDSHLEALHHIERGDDRTAARILTDLCASAPEYLPAVLELALLRARGHGRSEALRLMARVRDLATHLPAEAVIEGPEPLPAAFYLRAADAFFASTGASP